ncbi:MAG: MBL fold metallo-hydrolase [Acidobacteria bacterium]|nr:MAG: MBL fold metallo-hydrolase [Acidobacteriota bacterium]
MRQKVVLSLLMVVAVGLASAQDKLQADTFPTSGGDLRVTFIGHGTLMFQHAGKVVHVDPVSQYADYASLPKADVVLVTHTHGDHLDPKAIEAVRKADTVLVGNAASASNVAGIEAMKNGDARTVAGLRVEAVPAYNVSKQFHPKGDGNGYVITFGDKRVYVAGDTENVPEMAGLQKIDIAFLPMNLPFTMTPEMVAAAAKSFAPKVLYPYHFGSTDTSTLTALLAGSGIEVRIRNLK